MIPYYENDNVTLYNGDCLDVLKTLKNNSMQSIITSPPYWALRDYDIQGQLGLENDYKDYLNKLMIIFTECKRVLKDDGLLFINIADTYSGGGNNRGNTKKISDKQASNKGATGQVKMNWSNFSIKRKSLIGIPQRLQILMIDNGWICRNNIIWHKPNAMPHSVKDRFTVDFENIFMFSKQPNYKFNQITEPMKTKDLSSPRGSKGSITSLHSGLRNEKTTKDNYLRNKRTVWAINNSPLKEAHFAAFPKELIKILITASTNKNDIVLDIFSGSGTTLIVADTLGRKAIGIELSKKYCDITKNRLNNLQLKMDI